MTAPSEPTDDQIRTVLRAKLILAQFHCPGGKLMAEDFRGVIRTVANLTGADVPRVMTLALVEEGLQL